MADDAHVELAASAETQQTAPSDKPVSRQPPVAAGTVPGKPDEQQAPETVTHTVPPRCRARTRLYRDGALAAEGFPATEIKKRLAQGRSTVWLDLYDPEIDDLTVLTEEFGLHPLAVEDAVHDHERPKLDRYGDHLLLSAYAAELDTTSGTLATSELAAFITPAALITVRKDDRFDVDALVQRWDDEQDLAANGVAFLLYGLLDVLVDGHFTAVQSLDTQVENLQDLLFADTGVDTDVQRRSFELRKSLVALRRIVLPMREVLNTLMRRDLHLIDTELTPYYQDVYDHVLRASEWTESLRDLVSTVLETRLTIQGNRLNEIMKKLTSWAAIIAIPTAVTGFYGQNVPYPGFQQVGGFISSIVLILGLGVGLYVLFKRKEWL
ncbi:MAG: magnesium transporter CorA family protein [Pseudonocardia sp.]|nr:magnesium transporter CorA family protein [Pseudonocardia sp.]